MRAIIQRVTHASVSINQAVYSKIGHGFMVLLAVHHNDTDTDVLWMAKKIANLRVFNDAEQKMNLSLTDVSGEVLLVSQFTLYASTVKGNRPSFIASAKPEMAQMYFEKLHQELQKMLNQPIQTGVFGADMQVELLNDGPVTIVIDSFLKE
jgi:D-aminoacyl-tRNA deacylase